MMPSSDRIQMNGQMYYGVLIPTAPVPFGGAILYVPVDWVEPVDIATEAKFPLEKKRPALGRAKVGGSLGFAAHLHFFGTDAGIIGC